MQQPKKSKFRKAFRGRRKGISLRGSAVSFGEFGLQAKTANWVSARQIEAARKKITYMTKRAGKYWIRIFADKPITKKPVGVKMGSGKGAVDQYVAVVKPGMVLFEISGVPEALAKEALRKASHKLAVDTSIIKK